MRNPSDSRVLFCLVGAVSFALLTAAFLGTLALGAVTADAIDSARYLSNAGKIGAADVAAGAWAVLGMMATAARANNPLDR